MLYPNHSSPDSNDELTYDEWEVAIFNTDRCGNSIVPRLGVRVNEGVWISFENLERLARLEKEQEEKQ